MLLFMGGDRNNTEGEQTTKKWEADVHAKRYEKGKTVRGRPHDKGEEAVGFVSNNHGESMGG